MSTIKFKLIIYTTATYYIAVYTAAQCRYNLLFTHAWMHTTSNRKLHGIGCVWTHSPVDLDGPQKLLNPWAKVFIAKAT